MAIDYACKCKKCKYIDPTERSGYKWYCTYHGTYEDPDAVQECKDYREDQVWNRYDERLNTGKEMQKIWEEWGFGLVKI